MSIVHGPLFLKGAKKQSRRHQIRPKIASGFFLADDMLRSATHRIGGNTMSTESGGMPDGDPKVECLQLELFAGFLATNCFVPKKGLKQLSHPQLSWAK